VRISVRQSDEGGRFFRDVAEYQIVGINEAQPADGVIWLTLSEVTELMPKGIFDNEARSAFPLCLIYIEGEARENSQPPLRSLSLESVALPSK
jgi:oxidase EvaA